MASRFSLRLVLPIALTIAGSLSAGSSDAARLNVHPNGSGPYPTIQAAVDAAAEGDTVELGSGIFHGIGNRDVNALGKAITIRSVSGDPETCTIVCEGSETSEHFALWIDAGSALVGVSIVAGYNYHTGASSGVDARGPVLIQDCVFANNHAPPSGRAIALDVEPSSGKAAAAGRQGSQILDCVFVGNSGSDDYVAGVWEPGAVVERCTFLNNGGAELSTALGLDSGTARSCRFVGNAGNDGAGILLGAVCTVEDCWFEANHAWRGGALAAFDTDNEIRRCTFVGNSATAYGGAVVTLKGYSIDTFIESCTFYGNEAPSGSAFYGENYSFSHIDNCLAVANTGGEAVTRDGSHSRLYLACCDLYGNPGGDWAGIIAAQLGVDGNISADPLFCDATAKRFGLLEGSPCTPFTPPNPECDLIGAWPVGCETIDAPASVAPSRSFVLRIKPNPTAGACRIDLAGPATGPIRIEAFDAAGRRVWSEDSPATGTGSASTQWDGRSNDGRAAPGGVYLIRACDGAHVTSSRLVLIR
jgi:hypothetical protein